jgi:hypothetical protein
LTEGTVHRCTVSVNRRPALLRRLFIGSSSEEIENGGLRKTGMPEE